MSEDRHLKLEEVKAYAISRGGLCLSNEIKTTKDKLLFTCLIEGHNPWETRFNELLKYKRWCQQCSIIHIGKKRSNPNGLELAKKYAESKGGHCLSKDYINAITNMLWECDKQHTWEASYNTTTSSRKLWCPECVKDKQAIKHKFEDKLGKAKSYASSMGGQCLSESYTTQRNKLIWQCKLNHKPWAAEYFNIIYRGTWCPECAKCHKAEDEARIIIEAIYKNKFPNSRPKWNKSPLTNYSLELDMYCEALEIAFEYDGWLHYEQNYRIKNDIKRWNSFTSTLLNEFIKEQNCKENNVTLFRINAYKGVKKFARFFNYVTNELAKHNINCSFTIEELSDMESKYNEFRANHIPKTYKQKTH
jgi:hypothetical protein